MVPIAPRYDPRLVRVLFALDDRSVPIAELCRRLGQIAELLGVIRPSYPHVRRLVVAERRRVEALRLLAEEVVEDVVAATWLRSRRELADAERARALRLLWWPFRRTSWLGPMTSRRRTIRATARRYPPRRGPPPPGARG